MKKTVTSLKAALAVCVCVFAATASWAANGSWSGAVNALWTNSANWSASPYPSGTDTASFTTAGNGQPIDIAGLSSITSIMYDSPTVAAYTNGTGAANSQTLILADNGIITLTATAANSQLFNCGLQLGTTIAVSTYTLTNASTSKTLTLNNVFGPAAGGTAGAKTLAINGAGNTTILGNIQKGGATSLTLTDTSSGTLTLSGSNTVLTLNMNGGSNSVVDIGSGYLSLENTGSTILSSSQGGIINGTGGTIRLSTTAGYSFNYGDVRPAAGKTLVINPSIVSTGGFELNDAGTVVLNGINTFAGEVNFTAGGTISVSRIGNKGSTDSNLGMGTNIFVNAAGCTLRYFGIGETTDRIIELSQNFTIDHSGTGPLCFSTPMMVLGNTKTLTLQGSTAGIGEISAGMGAGTGTTSLSKNGTGTWILSAVNGYGGATTVNGGTLTLTGANGVITNSSGYTINAGGTLLLDNTSTANNTNRLRDASTVTLNGGTLCMTNNGGAVNYRENAGTLAVAPGGTSTIATTAAIAGQSNVLTFTSLTYSGGKLNFIGTGLGDSDQNRIFITGVTNGLMGAWATVNGTSYAAYSTNRGVYAFTTGFSDNASLGGVPESVITNNGALLARINLPGISGPITLQGALTNSIGQVLQNTTTNTTIAMLNSTTNKLLRAAGLSIAEGKAELKVGVSENDGTLSALTAGGTLVLENNSMGNALTVNAPIVNNTSASALSKTGAGMVVLKGTNTYSGNTYINEGVLAFGGSLTQTVTGIISGVGAVTRSGSGTLNLNAANTFTGGMTINDGTVITAQANGLGAGAVTNNGTLNLTGGALAYSGLSVSLAGSGTNNVTLGQGTASTTLSGNYSGFTGVWNIGINGTNGPGRAVMTGLDNSAAIINVLSNSTLWVNAAGVHNANLVLNGGHQGEIYGQLRIDVAEWAGPITLAGPITAVTDGFIGSMNQDGIISGIIGQVGGPYEMSKVGNNKTTLTGNNTFVGPVWVKAGSISVPSINSVSTGPGPLGYPTTADQGRIMLGNTTVAGTLIYTGTGNTSDRLIDFSGTTGGGTLDQSGTGLLKLTGGLMISGAGNKTLTFQGSTTGTGEFSGVISNGVGSTVSVTKAGTGTWILSGANTYAGSTILSSGKLIVANPNALGTNLLVLITGSATTLDFASNDVVGLYNYGFWFSSGYTSTISSSRATPGAAINRQLGYSGLGSSTLIFTNGANVTSGTPTFTLDLLNVSAGNAGTATLVPATANLSIGSIAIVTSSAPKTLQLDGTSSGNMVTGAISNGLNTLTITKSNTSTWTLFGTNTYSGTTTINGGTLLFNGSLSNSAVTVNSGGILGGSGTINGPVTANAGGRLAPGGVGSIASFNLSSNLTMNGGTLAFDISNVATDKVAVAGALIVNNANIVDLSLLDGSIPAGTYTLMTYASKSGSGSFTLARGYPNATLTAGATSLVLTIGAGGSGNGLTWKGNNNTNWDDALQNWVIGGVATNFSTGDLVTFDDTAANFTVASLYAVSPSYVAFNNASDYTVSANIGGTASLVKLGAGTTALTGLSTYNPSSVAVNGGMLTLGGTSTLNSSGVYAGSIFNESLLNYASSVAQNNSGSIAGAGSLIQSGSGTLTLSGSNTFSGTVTVKAGSFLQAKNAFALGTVAGGTTVEAGGTLNLSDNISYPAEALNLYGTLSSQTGSNTYAGAVTVQTGSPTFDVATGSFLILTESIAGAVTAPFTKIGGGTLRLTKDPNNYGTMTINNGVAEITSGTTDGNIIINSGGTFLATAAAVVNDANTVTVNTGGIYDLRGADTISSLNGAGLVTKGTTGAAIALTVGGNNNGSGSFSGVIENGAGVLALTKVGTGTQILSGVNTYTGLTSVTGGTLLVNGSTATNSAVTAANGGTLGGTGTINGPVNMASGSTLLPGDANIIGTLTLANNSATALTLNASLLRYDLSNQVNVCDVIAIIGASGNLVLNGANIVQLNFLNGSAPAGDYTLMTFNSYTGSGSFALASSYPNASLVLNANSLVLHVVGGGTSAGLTWKGFYTAVWDGGIQNWSDGTTYVAFTPGDAVTFDDTALQNFTVTSGTAVSPSSMLFNNSANAYTISGTVSGTAPLVKNGSNTAALSGVTTYNPSVLTINAGTLALAGASRLNSGLYATNILNNGTLSYASSATQTLSGVISGPGALTMSSLGLLTLAGTNTFMGTLTVNSGTMVLNGSNALTTALVNVGASAGSNAVMKLPLGGSLVGSGDMTAGSISNGYGAVFMNGGQVLRTNIDAEKNFAFGTVTGGYGYFNMSDGTLSSQRIALGINAGVGTALARITGGISNFKSWVLIGRSNGGIGVMTIDGGSVYHTNATQNLSLNYDGGRGELNMTGGLFDNTGQSLVVRNAAGSATGIVNICSGTLVVNSFVNNATAFLNFNGGLLTASAASTTFLPTTLTGVYVNGPFGANAGGARIDTAGKDITFAAPLLAPLGSGVTGISLSTQGSGYIGEPYVSITGDGVGATAVANMVDDGTGKGTYKVANVTVTAPGINYTTASVSFLKGGAAAQAPTVSPVTPATTAPAGLTKLGLGTLTLGGTNTYAGVTTISNGTLRLGIANALPSNNVVNVRGGIFDLGGFTVTNGAVNVTSGAIVNGRLMASSITVDDSATIAATLTGNNGITKNGNGTLVVRRSASDFTTGPLVVNGGTLKLMSGPLDAGLSYWLDAADGSKMTLSGSNVTAWADSTVFGVNFTQVNAAQQPVYVTNAINGRPAVNFNGITNRLIATKSANAQTVFIVNTVKGSTTGNDGIWGQNLNDYGIRLASTTAWVFYPTANVNDFTYSGGQMFVNGVFTNIFAASTPHVLTAVSATQRAWTTAIGEYWNNSQRWFKGDIGEVLVYSSILSTNDRRAVESYLMAKWLGTANTNLPTGGSVSLASGTLLDLDSQAQTIAGLSGSGTVSNGALTVTGTVSPAGTNLIGMLTAKVNTTLSGKLVVDVATDGTCDRLDVQGTLTLSSPALEIQNLQGLSTIRVYTLATCSGTLSGSLTPPTFPDSRWTLRYTDGKVQLYFKGGTLLLLR